MKDSFDTIAAKLAENEMAVAALYLKFARTFPEDVALWAPLAEDEQRHADWVSEVRCSVAASGSEPEPGAVRVQAIDTMTRYIQSIGERCGKGELNRTQACARARDLENSILENKLFTILGNSPELRNLQQRLVTDETAHRKRIDETLGRLKNA